MDFLGRLHRQGIGKENVHTLLKGTAEYLLGQTLDTTKYMCYFPAWAAEQEPSHYSRLGWCYGDLGTGVVLWLTARRTNNEKWREKALEILLHSTQRREPANTGVVDAGLCHGTAGIAHIYNRMYHYTGQDVFREAALYWFDRTLEMASFDDGYAGYKALHGERRGGRVKEAGLLEGITGIGLALISAVSTVEPKWDQCLLLSE
jgi:lantibiotic modifying enzyme